MILSRTSRYALRAVGYVAAHEGEADRVRIDEIAASLKVPRNYMSKVLNELARVGVLDSLRGRGGGFRLAIPADVMTVQQVVAPFEEGGATVGCLLHDRPCDIDRPCLAHERWKEAAAAARNFFAETTVQDLLSSRRSP